jgi:hypothetical protein
MPKVLKYKKGFTLRHHLDEKWDRLDYGFKIKFQGFILLIVLGVVVSGLVWANQKNEKNELLESRNHSETPKELSKFNPVISDPSLRTDKE